MCLNLVSDRLVFPNSFTALLTVEQLPAFTKVFTASMNLMYCAGVLTI